MPPVPATLAKCDEQLPLLPVVRQFDFGQFVSLYHEDASGRPRRVVLTDQGALATQAQKQSAIAAATIEGHPAPKFLQRLPSTVELFDVLGPSAVAVMPQREVAVPDVSAFLSTGRVESDGVQYVVQVDENLEQKLGSGYSMTVDATTAGATPAKVRILLVPFVKKVTLRSADLDRLIAGEPVTLDIRGRRGELGSRVLAALLDGQLAIVRATGGGAKSAPVAVRVEGAAAQPASSDLQIDNLAEFLARPRVPGRSGEAIDVALTPTIVEALRTRGTAEIPVGGARVRASVMESTAAAATAAGPAAINISTSQPSPSRIHTLATAPAAGGDFQLLDLPITPVFLDIVHQPGMRPLGKTLSELVLPRLDPGTGLAVALLVPWRQNWKLKGFSRGNLLQSLAMAPQEEITIQVTSWERRSGPVEIEEASETARRETALAAETRTDTDDIFNELLTRHDYAWQFQGSVDVAMTGAGISLGTGAGFMEDGADKLFNVASNSRANLRQATTRASANVRAKRTTRVTQTSETGGASSLVRKIRNPNPCHTLTFDFFEVLAHYEIELEFVADRLQLVVMVPNPLDDDFNPLRVRTHESILARALIEPALAGGFEALRLTNAYERAVELLRQHEATKTAARRRLLEVFRTQTKTQPPPEPIVEQVRVESILKDIKKATKLLIDTANYLPAITTIGAALNAHAPVVISDDARTRFNRWLFIQLAKAKLPTTFAALEEFAKSETVPNVDDARRLVGALPGPARWPSLETLNDVSGAEKEAAGLLSAMWIVMVNELDRPAFSAAMRDHRLYFVDTVAIPAYCDLLRNALVDLDLRREELEMEVSKEILLRLAEAKQELAIGMQEVMATADKLATAFPFDDVAHAYERQEALLQHLNDYKDHYNYALFQSLPSDEQSNRIVVASGNKLHVGMFEPRVIAMEGSNLAIPLTSFGQAGMKDFVDYMATEMGTRLARPAGIADDKWNDSAIVPTPGITISSRLGDCSTCDQFVEQGHQHDLRRREAEANIAVAEAARRELRNQKGLLGNPAAPDETTPP